MTSLLVLGGIAIAIVLYVISLYNRLVKNRQSVEEGWSGIDVQLKRRSNLIPNLLAAVKGYMKHEKGLLEDITKMRAHANEVSDKGPEERAKAEGALGAGLMNLFAVMENYPDLKANQNVMDFQNSLSEIEDQIQMSRRYYNGAVRIMNVSVESFPSNLVANQFGFIKAEFFEIEDPATRQVPKVEF
ncbi:MAG TPA: LemA family protein [Rhizobiales bacterium]|nr:LemA family protein [Hyphomicrobiales bacterium]